MMRIPSDDPITIREETSGLESIQLEEISGLENPRVPSPQIRSPMTFPTQPEISRIPGETGVPNTLFDLIMIYDDEESLEVSPVTLGSITEEKEPEKTYASVQNLLHNDHEVKSVLALSCSTCQRPQNTTRWMS
jgi:hypothetical protein